MRVANVLNLGCDPSSAEAPSESIARQTFYVMWSTVHPGGTSLCYSGVSAHNRIRVRASWQNAE